ncbi:MAG TPA: hypothetical protein VGF67_23050 [Ktedonobacteraceae bacterium]|jgi:hypothetical protein
MNVEKRRVAISPAGENDTERGEGERILPQDLAGTPAGGGDIAAGQPRYRWLLSPLWLCLLLALAIRVVLIVRTHGTLDGDEALLGIQAEHILQGERPIYFYGIPYFGSLEAYVAALLFAVAGPSVAALRAETTAFALLLVCATWWLAALLAKAAHLPAVARKSFPLVAALVAALPPLYDGIVELRTGGGWIESFVLMLLLLIAVYRLTTRWHEKALYRELALRWAGVGLLVGFGMWIYPLVSVAILAAALWILLDRLHELVTLVRAALPWPVALQRSLCVLLPGVAALPACVVGFAPGVIWGALHNWENIRYIFGLGGGWTLHRLITVARVTTRYAGCVSPRIIGGATPFEGTLLSVLHAPLLLIGVLCSLGSLALVACSLRWSHPALLGARRLVALPALFGLCSAALFCVSSASASILISCQDDFGGRYAAPLVLALPFFCATIFALCAQWFRRQRGQAAPARRPSGRRVFLALPALLVVLAAYLAGQATTYALTNPDLAFQSPWCTMAPADYRPIIAYMEREHVRFAWATNLLAYPISFLTKDAIVMADPAAITQPRAVINRIPASTNAVQHAARPALLVFVKHGDAHPYLLAHLDAAHVTYTFALFPSQPGIDVLVVVPISRTVSPFAPGLDIFYCQLVNPSGAA